MEAIIFKAFSTLFRLVAILMLTGTLVATLTDLQRRAFKSKRVGLVRMYDINRQLVGPAR